MCGRYLLTSPTEAIRQTFDVRTGVNLAPRYNIAPTQEVPVIRVAATGLRDLAVLRWGLVPSWMREPPDGRPVINARIESVREKPFFRSAIKSRRCLVPADGFYEWQKQPGGKRPMLVRLKGGKLFAFAGLFESWQDRKTGEILETMAILTMPANKALQPIHDRMPLILRPDDHGRWLGETGNGALDPMQDVAPPGDDEFEAFEVSTYVNNVRNDDPACAEPVKPTSLELD